MSAPNFHACMYPWYMRVFPIEFPGHTVLAMGVHSASAPAGNATESKFVTVDGHPADFLSGTHCSIVQAA